MAAQATILLIGGGSGGHIFPNLAVQERLAEHHWQGTCHYLVSGRSIDRQILDQHHLAGTALAARTLGRWPWHWWRFFGAWRAVDRQVAELIKQHRVTAAVATGGFVSAPAVAALRKRNVPVALVNLDAVPGRANRLLARRATAVFAAYDVPALPNAARIGVPLRREAIGPDDNRAARRLLGLDPDRRTLLITGASQGASSLNQMAWHMTRVASARDMLAKWQVLHLAGATDAAALREAYQKAGIPARVEPLLAEMGLAWRSASVAISRAGAGSVAEAWVNATPTIFLPYPYHKDQHQRWNVQPLVDGGAALVFRDWIDPVVNTNQIMGPLTDLMSDQDQRDRMRQWLRATRPTDGAEVLAQWVMTTTGKV